MAEKIRVYITIDTETSMGGAWRNPQSAPVPLDGPVFGKCGSRQCGIPLIAEILEEHGLRGTFFVEVFCSYLLGMPEVGRVFDYINKRGHDAQLHLHPTYRLFRDYKAGGPRRETDLIAQFTSAEQVELLGDATRLFERFCGRRPRAYRAGCYGASETTLSALKANGIEIDSSYNLAYLDQTCRFEMRGLNAPAVIEGVYELPVTVFRVPFSSGYKPLEISAVSTSEMLSTIDNLREAGSTDVVLVLHSFSLMKNCGLRYETSRPDDIVIRRFRTLCRALRDRSAELQVTTFGAVDVAAIRAPQRSVLPSVRFSQAAARKFVQGINRAAWI
jgi:hypothetical protein